MKGSKDNGKKGKSAPERSCVACRQQKPQHELLRVVLAPDQSVWMDYLGKCPGRGAYVCPSPECLKRAAEKGGFARSFKQNVKADFEVLYEEALQASSRQIRGLLALAHRAKHVSAGNSQVEVALRHYQAALLLIACDASDGVRQKFRRWAERSELPVYEVLSKADLAPSVGQATCALITINDPGFAQKIEKEAQRANLLTQPPQ